MAHRYNKWTEYEDNILTELVQRHGNSSWSLIAKEMKENYEISKRSGKQCRERWFNQLDHANLTRKWTEEEDFELIAQQAILGTKWIDIAQHFPGRSDNNVKNRFYSIVRKSIRKMCRYIGAKTTSMKVYSIKPSTLSRVFVQGSSELQQGQQEGAPGVCSALDSRFRKQNYFEITQIIKYFVFDNSQLHSHAPPSKQQVADALTALIEINERLQKDSSSDFNSPQSFSESEKKESSSPKNWPMERQVEKMELEMREEVKEQGHKQKMQEQIQEHRKQRIMSSKSLQEQGLAITSGLPIVLPNSKSMKEIIDNKEPIDLQAKPSSCSLIKKDSQFSLGSNYDFSWYVGLNQEFEFEEMDQIRIYMTPRKSNNDIFNKYLQ